MATNDYFKSVLAAQTPADDSPEMKELQTNRAAVEKVLQEAFPGASATIRYGGSKAKGTLILESYDLDIVFYVPNGNNAAGETLQDIFDNVNKALAKHYAVEPKTSALRLRSTGRRSDLHIDVVPGRFTDDNKTDCYLHQANGQKHRLKTNLDVHTGSLSSITLQATRSTSLAFRVAPTPLDPLPACSALAGSSSEAMPQRSRKRSSATRTEREPRPPMRRK